MYRISIPTVVNSPSYDRAEVLKELKRAGAERVLLAIGTLEYKTDKGQRDLDILERDIPYFKENGFEVGVWFWGIMMSGETPFTKITDFDGNSRKIYMCPSDDNFISFMQDFVAKLTSLSPDLLLLDDDIRFGNLGIGFGCCCQNHLRMMSEELGEEVTVSGLYEKMFSGKPNKYRSAFLRSCGKSLENYCKMLREAVDSVNSRVRLGLCACISNYDTDGTDAFTMAKLLAGSTKPYLRLIGAPYWGASKAWGHRISDVIEHERLQRSFYKGADIEIVSEGDPYPRPRYAVPSIYLEIFDTALRASGGFSGIQKYMIDYNSCAKFEREYINRHVANAEIYNCIEEMFDQKDTVGVRIYEAQKKLEFSDFTHRRHTVDTIADMPFSRAFRFTSENSIPSVFEGSGICGISFGENIRSFISDKTVFERPLAIDLPAARILMENGIDVGLEEILDEVDSRREYFTVEDEYTASWQIAYKVVLKENAKILSSFIYHDKESIPAAYTYVNSDGMRFLVYTFDAQLSNESVYRTYARQKQFINAMKDFGVIFPVVIHDCPDLYVITKKSSDGKTAIGLWNCFADAVYDKEIILDESFTNARIVNFSGELCENKIIIKKLCGFDFGFIELSK